MSSQGFYTSGIRRVMCYFDNKVTQAQKTLVFFFNGV